MGRKCDCVEIFWCSMFIVALLIIVFFGITEMGTVNIKFSVLNEVCADYYGKEYMFDAWQSSSSQINCKLKDEYIPTPTEPIIQKSESIEDIKHITVFKWG